MMGKKKFALLLALKLALGAAALFLVYHGVKQVQTTYRVTVSHTEWLKTDYLSDEHASYEELVKASCVKVEPAGSCDFIPRKHILIRGK